MWMDGQRHAPATLPPGNTRYPLYRRLGGLQGRSGGVRKISPPPGYDPRIVLPVASRYTEWAIPAHTRTLHTGRNLWMHSGKINGPRKAILIPSIDLRPSGPAIPSRQCRRRFAIKIAVAMTIRNAQGQTLKRAAGYTPLPAVCGIYPDPIHLTASLLQLLKVFDSACKLIAWWRHCISKSASNFPIIYK